MNIINDFVDSQVSSTFWQLPLCCRSSSCSSRRLGLLGANGGASAGVATHHRHGIVITTSLQGIPVGDEGEPAVLSLQCHLERHEALQVHVAGEKAGGQTDKMNKLMHPCIQRTNLTYKTRCTFQLEGKKKEASHQPLTHQKQQLHQLSQTPVALKASHPSAQQKKGKRKKKKNLHSPLVLSHKLGGEFAEDVQESQVERRASFSLGTRFLKCKLDTIPERCTETESAVRNKTVSAEEKDWFHGHKTKVSDPN